MQEKFPNQIEQVQGTEVEKSEESLEIKIPEIAELRKPMQQLLLQLRKSIEKGEYAVILGDDASGRIPTLLFRKVLNALYTERRFEVPKTLFFAGVRFDTMPRQRQVKMAQDFTDYLVKENVKGLTENRKALVVTDTISSGQTLKNFMQVLRELGIHYNIATIGRLYGRTERLGGKIASAQKAIPSIYGYGQHKYGGVEKDRDNPSLFAKRMSGSTPYEVQKLSRARSQARKDVDILARQLVEWYETQNSAKE